MAAVSLRVADDIAVADGRPPVRRGRFLATATAIAALVVFTNFTPFAFNHVR